MEEWFYVKNNLIEREDIKEIIQRPIWYRFGLQRPMVAIESDAEACQKAFSNVCAFIGTRDIIQEHIAYRVWPLVDSWEMPKETTTESSEGGLVRMKYTFRFRDRFDEPNDDGLTCVEATSNELLRAYTRAKDDAMTLAFNGRGKKRLNRVFNVIGFVYPDYCCPSRKQGKKRKAATSTTSSASKSKKVKVLTHRPKRIETAEAPKLVEGSTFVFEPSRSMPLEAKTGPAEEPKLKEATKQPKALSPPRETELTKASRIPVTTPRKRRMASVLDAIMEFVKVSTPASAEAPNIEGRSLKKSDETGTTQDILRLDPQFLLKQDLRRLQH